MLSTCLFVLCLARVFRFFCPVAPVVTLQEVSDQLEREFLLKQSYLDHGWHDLSTTYV